jgi:hypothetical protein
MAPKPKPRPKPKPKPTKPLTGLLGEFVRSHYGDKQEAGAYKKLAGNKALVPIRQADGSILLTRPNQRQQMPDTFIGSEGVRGGFVNITPRLNPDEYEFAQNRVGVTYARPRTEFTGLAPQNVADVKAFDQLTNLQGHRITSAYDAYAQQAGADRDRATQALGDLARLAGQGMTPTVGTGLSATEKALSGVIGSTASAESAARSSQTIADLNQLPTVARSEGLGASEAFRATRYGQRQEMLTGLRAAQAEAEAAAAAQAAEESQFNRTLASQVRGQNLDLLGQLGGQQASMQEVLARLNADAASQASDQQFDMSMAQTEAAQDAQAAAYRTPAKLRAAGFTMGKWATKPKKVPKGIVLEQGSDGAWYGKPPKGSATVEGGIDRNTRQRAIADILSDVGVKIPVTDAEGNVTGQRSLSAAEVAQAIAKEYKVPIVWAYDQARKAGFHARPGEFIPPKWKSLPPNARTPVRPGGLDLGSILGGL